MGYASNAGTVCMLTALNSDLEFQINSISMNLMQLQSVASQLSSAGANMLPGSAASIQFQAEQANLSQIEKSLEVNLEQVEIEQRSVVTQLQSVQKELSEDIKNGFTNPFSASG